MIKASEVGGGRQAPCRGKGGFGFSCRRGEEGAGGGVAPPSLSPLSELPAIRKPTSHRTTHRCFTSVFNVAAHSCGISLMLFARADGTLPVFNTLNLINSRSFPQQPEHTSSPFKRFIWSLCYIALYRSVSAISSNIFVSLHSFILPGVGSRIF